MAVAVLEVHLALLKAIPLPALEAADIRSREDLSQDYQRTKVCLKLRRQAANALTLTKGSHNTTSTTYPRTQRFGPVVSPVERHLSDLPQPIPGGRRHSAAPPANAAKIKKLEEESEKLRKQIDEKKKVLRQELHEWDNVGREATKYRLAGDLAEGNLKKLEEMGVGENYVPENGEAQKVPEQEERDD